jgi:hypothetical protein
MAIGGPGDASGGLSRPDTLGPAPSMRPGSLAALERETDTTAAAPPAPAVADHPADVRSERKASPYQHRERGSRRNAARQYWAPPPPRSSTRYSSFQRPGSVHSFFFDPKRTY